MLKELHSVLLGLRGHHMMRRTVRRWRLQAHDGRIWRRGLRRHRRLLIAVRGMRLRRALRRLRRRRRRTRRWMLLRMVDVRRMRSHGYCSAAVVHVHSRGCGAGRVVIHGRRHQRLHHSAALLRNHTNLKQQRFVLAISCLVCQFSYNIV